MSFLSKRQEDLITEFNRFKNWEDRYRRLIEIGKSLPPLSEEQKLDDYKVKGCQSQVWLIGRLDENNRVQFEADSDAILVKGLVALLLRVYSNATPDDILNTPPDFIHRLGFASHLSPSRANGLFSMVKQILYYATAFKSLISAKSPE
ncbi:MAG: SufE family protein [Bdellovibrionales bacterium]|nr:SufE family protein [Bdellovibrionales bacterium]